jgi:hypothetical protein
MGQYRPFCGAFTALLLVLCGLAGCASTPQASRERDDEAKQFASSPAAATVYVYRTDNLPDDSVLWIGDRLIGATLPHTYFRVPVNPGRHVIGGWAADNGRIALEVRPGQVYYVSLAIHAGQSYFRLEAREVGQKVITNCCVLLENWAPGQRPLLR